MGRYSNFPEHLTQIEHLVGAAENPIRGRPAREVRRAHKIEQRLDPAVLVQIAAAYDAGMTTRQIMRLYQLGKGTVLRILRDQGVVIRNQSLTSAECEKAISLYLQGWSLERVGRHFGREHTVIRDILVRAGVPRRDSHGRPR